MKNISSYLIVLFLSMNVVCLTAQERQLKRIVEIHKEISDKGEVELDTVYYGRENDCFLTTIKIDTLKIENDTIWEKHFEIVCGKYQSREYVKYKSSDTIITKIKNLNDSLLLTIKRYKVGYKKEKEIHIQSLHNTPSQVFIIDNSIPFRVKSIAKGAYNGGTLYNEARNIYIKLTDNSRFYHYDNDKKKWVINSKTINATRQNRIAIKYHTYDREGKRPLFKISSREKKFLDNEERISLTKYYYGYSLKPYKQIYYYYEYY